MSNLKETPKYIQNDKQLAYNTDVTVNKGIARGIISYVASLRALPEFSSFASSATCSTFASTYKQESKYFSDRKIKIVVQSV
jgi:hypothetical protein